MKDDLDEILEDVVLRLDQYQAAKQVHIDAHRHCDYSCLGHSAEEALEAEARSNLRTRLVDLIDARVASALKDRGL